MNNAPTLITQFHPNMLAHEWAPIRDFVCDAVRDRYADGRAATDVTNALSAVTGFAAWAVASGMDARENTLLRADVIDAYTAYRATSVTVSVSERERKMLRTIAGLSNTPQRDRATTNAMPSMPYTHEEQNDIRRWATIQPSAARRRVCSAIATMGLGCGLTAHEMMSVRASDVLLLEDGMAAVTVDGRIVPVLASWDEEMKELADGQASDFLIAPRGDRRDNISLGVVLSAARGQAPSAQRMRATWLLAHVDGGTPLNNLIAAAGLTSPDVLRRLLPHALRLEGLAHVRALRLSTEVAR